MTTEERIRIEERLAAIVATGSVTFAVTPYNEYGQHAVEYLRSIHGVSVIALDNYKKGDHIESYANTGQKGLAEGTVILMASRFSDIRATLFEDIKKYGLTDAKVVDLFSAEELVEKDVPRESKDIFKRMKAAGGRRLLEKIVRDKGSFFVFAGGGLGDTLAVACMLEHIKSRYSPNRLDIPMRRSRQSGKSETVCPAEGNRKFFVNAAEPPVRCGVSHQSGQT